MRLTTIKLAGFKSFVDPTTIPIIGNLAAIVGPNGCGKSNVIDAVRWVMGESSAKNLRGGQIADVIFNGSTSRKPLGQASVELMFDNSDGSLGGEYAGFSDIAIRRLVTRDGQSQYFLNGTRCRRKDITDVFLGTGLGPRSYSIIEQGMISKVIEAKPEELRNHVEEAAGISKYKERRRETETRILHTRENLERLTDLRDELEKQLDHLHKQAQAAEKFKTLKTEERLCSAQLAALTWKKLDDEIQTLEHTILHSTNDVEATQTQRQSIETEIEKSRELAHEATEQLNQIQEQYYQFGNQITRIEQTLKHHEERRMTLEDDHHQAQTALVEARVLLESDLSKIALFEAELESLSPQSNQAKEAYELIQSQLSERELALEDWRAAWELLQRETEQAGRNADIEKTKIAQLEKQITQAKIREQKLMDELALLSGTGDASDLNAIEVSMQEALEQVGQLDIQLAECQMQKRQLSDELLELKKEIKDQEKALQQEEGRLASLEALQAATDGESSSELKGWLERQGFAQYPRLYQKIEIESAWTHALETVLADGLESLLVNESEWIQIAEQLEHIESGSLSVLMKAGTQHESGTLLPRLLDHVKSFDDVQVSQLLAGIYAVDSVEVALKHLSQLSAHESIVTKTGVWLGANWVRVSRKIKDPRHGILQREQAIKSLKNDLALWEQKLQAIRETLKDKETTLNAMDEQREHWQFERNQAFKVHTEQKATLATKRERLHHLSTRTDQITKDLEEIKSQCAQWQTEIDAARQKVQTAIDIMSELNDKRSELEHQKTGVSDSLKEMKDQASLAKEAEHTLALKVNQLDVELKTIQSNITRFESQIHQLEDRLHQIVTQKESNEAPIEGLRAELEGYLESRLSVEETLNQARDKTTELENQMRQLEKMRYDLEQTNYKKRESLERAKMNWQALSVRKEGAIEKIKESEFELHDLLEHMPEDAEEKLWQERLERMAGQIQRLGAINLAAIDEYAVQSERKSYLDTQDKDLNEALATLEGAIAKIDKETRHRFQETFDKINTNFKELFPRLFGGGQAYLELTGDDLLETGITMLARPPGKKNSTIHLLSGGEKALTAMALVFSIFQLNPAPFCMLDEVDAPLDDYNVGRFCNLVKSMSQSLQFIYISHNKLALEMADQLQGVTMKEPGVSKIVTVDVEEARSLAEA